MVYTLSLKLKQINQAVKINVLVSFLVLINYYDEIIGIMKLFWGLYYTVAHMQANSGI